MNNDFNNSKIIGFDQQTGQPIFDRGIEEVNSNNNEKINTVEQKLISKGKFIFHILLSFGVWNLIFGFLFNILISSVVFNLVKNNAVIYMIICNCLWILASGIEIFLTLWFNKYHTVYDNELSSSKNICLILFYILIIFVNKTNIATLFNYNMIVQSIFSVAHIVIIYIINDKLFNKYFGRDCF